MPAAAKTSMMAAYSGSERRSGTSNFGSAQHLAEVAEGVAAHRVHASRLPRVARRLAGLPQRREVENRGQGRHPRLVLVLRAEVAEDLVREMALEQLRRPVLPR